MDFLASLSLQHVARAPGAGVFVSPAGEVDADAFVRFLVSARRLPEQLVFVRHRVEMTPNVPLAEQVQLEPLAHGITLAQVRFGYDDDPDVPRALQACRALAIPQDARYFVSPEESRSVRAGKMARWRQYLFLWMAQFSVSAIEYLHLPLDRTTLLP